MTRYLILVLLLTGCTAQQRLAPAGKAPAPPPSSEAAGLGAIEPLVASAVAEKKLPGAVVLVGQGDRTLYHRAIGYRALVPIVEPMMLDTIFDLASLTKVVATATSVMILVDEGKIGLNDRVAAYIPGFERYGKGTITIRHLLTHVSGLRPDVDLADSWTGSDTAIALAVEEVPTAAPGTRFIYSDINFFLLGDIIRRVSGQTLDRFAADRIFTPLGLKETGFNPPESWRTRIAPTDPRLAPGNVHDPTARRMGGVAGHAGLFSTASDLATFCRMLLDGGTFRGVRVLSPMAVARMTSPATAPGERNVRGLGWDIDSSFSANRGELFPIGSFGHTGFTGTSLWLDPSSGMFVIFLSNRVHPDGKGDVTPLRARVATIAASTLTASPPVISRNAPMSGSDFVASGTGPASSSAVMPVLNGIDVLREEGFQTIKGKRVGLVTNHTGRARDGATTIDLLHGSAASNGHSLVALFSPEHGIRGVLDSTVPSTTDEKTRLPINSLYGDTRRPTGPMLDGIDTLVIDLQDIGARFYTYMTTMAYVMEEAAKRKLSVVVLDRPNPIDGFQIEGPALDKDAMGFTGYFPMPVRHGMTLGELARLFNVENRIGADLTVVSMKNWRRDEWYDQTGLPWINPSPNMRNLLQATLYPGIGAIEGTNVSVGRGTDTPFEQLGAPWIDGVRLSDALNGRGIPGVRFYPVRFTPGSSKYANEECQGVFIVVTDRLALRPVRLGVEIATMLHRFYGAKYELDAAERLLGSKDTISRIRAGDDPQFIAASWAADDARWRLLRSKYLLYY